MVSCSILTIVTLNTELPWEAFTSNKSGNLEESDWSWLKICQVGKGLFIRVVSGTSGTWKPFLYCFFITYETGWSTGGNVAITYSPSGKLTLIAFNALHKTWQTRCI